MNRILPVLLSPRSPSRRAARSTAGKMAPRTRAACTDGDSAITILDPTPMARTSLAGRPAGPVRDLCLILDAARTDG